jgi:hypothetical protein
MDGVTCQINSPEYHARSKDKNKNQDQFIFGHLLFGLNFILWFFQRPSGGEINDHE